MMGSAQMDLAPELELTAGASEALPEPRPSELRQQVAERLAAHRQRRKAPEAAVSTEALKPRSPKHRVAAAVAERYAQTPSYRAFLAEQAQRAVEEAHAAAEIALRNAEAVAAAQQQLLGELELWSAPQEFNSETAITIESVAASEASEPKQAPRLKTGFAAGQPATLREQPGLTVRLYEDLRNIPPPHAPARIAFSEPASVTLRRSQPDGDEAVALDAEIAFRQAPVFEEFWVDEETSVPLAANLLEFPRQLVAARRARPRLAEGPLRDEVTPRTAQLRIFEVEPEQISTAAPHSAAADWTSIHLDAHSMIAPQLLPDAGSMPVLASMLPPRTAPLELRFMSATVDLALAAGGALAFVAAYARAGGEIPLGLPAVLAVCGVLTVTAVLYQLLFFTFGDQTPGMRYARIGLCTFSDENPSRSAIRRRVLAQFVALCPLGIGLLWIVLDDDGLGWHDRISHMYQRSY